MTQEITQEKSTQAAVLLITDGACSGNPGPGGFGAIIRCGEHEKTLFGYAPQTTNNQMELMAVIAGLNALERNRKITIITDSKYVLDGATKWMANWLKKGWKTASNQPVKNQNLWIQLNNALAVHELVKWQWIKGHTGHVDNERADALARAAIINKDSNTKFSLVD